MSKSSDAKKRSNKKYLSKFEQVSFRVPRGEKEKLKRFIKSKGFDGFQSFFIHLLKKEGYK